jgi:hypothetical protein
MKSIKQIALAVLMVVTVGVAWQGVGVNQAQAHPESGCSSCHVPHAAYGDSVEVPLWNPTHTTTTLVEFYSSPSMDADVGQVDGASKLCLSCHDGSYPRVQSEGRTNFGTGGALATLENSHPVSFIYDQALATADGSLKDPTTLPQGILDGNSKVQCTSCHEVHATPTRQVEKNLRWAYVTSGGPTSNTTTSFCRNCHIK